MSNAQQDIERIARDYYDSEDADHFYATVWGGEDIHIGLYDDTDDIREASRRTVLHMVDKLLGLKRGARVLDLGSGYGGAARVLAARHDAHVTCLNLSHVENERNRRLTAEQGLSARIDIIDGSYEAAPFADGAFDIVWSQDAILHAADRRAVLKEAARVLKPDGEIIFTDPMQADGLVDASVLQPIYDRIHLNSLASFEFYRRELSSLGFAEVEMEDLTPQLRAHYAHIAQKLRADREALAGKITPDYIDAMLKGLDHWVDGARKGWLAWGVIHFQKR